MVISANLDNVWIARVHVKPRKGFEHILDGALGAYVNIIVKANNREELKLLTEKVFFDEGFIVAEFIDEDAELFSERLKKFTVDQDILDLVANLNETYPVQFGVFDSYESEE